MGELELTWVVALFGITIILLGVLGLIRPGNLMRLVLGAWQSRKGFYFSIGIRVVFGIVLLLAASQSRFPEPFAYWASFLWWLRWLPHFLDSIVCNGSFKSGQSDPLGSFAAGR